MQINKISNQNFNGYKIYANENKNVEYLYNKTMEAMKQEQQTVVYTRDYIKFDKLTEKIKQKLESFKIIFKKEEK